MPTDDCLSLWSVSIFYSMSRRPFASHRRPYLHLLERNLKAEGLVVVRIQSVLLHRRLLLLQPLSVLQQVNLHVGIWRREEEEKDVVRDPLKGHVRWQLQCPGSPTDGASAEAGDYCMVSAAVSHWLSSQAAHPSPHTPVPPQSYCQRPHFTSG